MSVIRPIVDIISLEILTLCIIGVIMVVFIIKMYKMLKGKYSIWMAGTYWVGLIYTFLRGLFWWKDFLESTQLDEVNYRRYMEDYVELNIGFSLIMGCTLLVSGIICKIAAANLKEKRAGKIIISISLLIAMLLVPIFLGFIVDDRENAKNFAIGDIKAMETIYPAFNRANPDEHWDAVIWENGMNSFYKNDGITEIKCYQNSTESDYSYDCDPRFIYWPNLE